MSATGSGRKDKVTDRITHVEFQPRHKDINIPLTPPAVGDGFFLRIAEKSAYLQSYDIKKLLLKMASYEMAANITIHVSRLPAFWSIVNNVCVPRDSMLPYLHG